MSVPQRKARQSFSLPPYQAVLVVDAEKFSQNPSRDQGLLHTMLRDALQMAFADAGLAELWENASFPQSTGDGYIVGVDPAFLPHLIHPLMGTLQSVLDEMQPSLAYANRAMRLRLRAAIGVGPLPDSGGASWGDGIGTAMNETHRVLDARPLDAALKENDPEATHLAVALTQRVYEDAVLGGYVGMSRHVFQEIDVDLPDKQFHTTAHVYVPRPAARSTSTGPNAANTPAPAVPSGGAPADNDDAPVGRPSPGSVAQPTATSGGIVFQSGTAEDITFGGRSETHHHGGVGDITGNVGTAFGSAHGPVNTGSGDQINAPTERNDERHQGTHHDRGQ